MRSVLSLSLSSSPVAPRLTRSFHFTVPTRALTPGGLVLIGVVGAVVFLGPRVVIPRIVEAFKMTKDALEGKAPEKKPESTEGKETEKPSGEKDH